MKPAQPFHNHDFRLPHDFERACEGEDPNDRDDEQKSEAEHDANSRSESTMIVPVEPRRGNVRRRLTYRPVGFSLSSDV